MSKAYSVDEFILIAPVDQFMMKSTVGSTSLLYISHNNFDGIGI